MVKKPKLDNKLAILRQFSSQIVLAVLVIVILIAVYGAYQEEAKKTEALPLSDLVRKISAGEVVSITVSGSNLDIVDKDTKHYSAKKEAESSYLKL